MMEWNIPLSENDMPFNFNRQHDTKKCLGLGFWLAIVMQT